MPTLKRLTVVACEATELADAVEEEEMTEADVVAYAVTAGATFELSWAPCACTTTGAAAVGSKVAVA